MKKSIEERLKEIEKERLGDLKGLPDEKLVNATSQRISEPIDKKNKNDLKKDLSEAVELEESACLDEQEQ